MKRALATILFLVFAATAYAQTLKLSSQYSVTGTNPNGTNYRGDIQLRPLSDSTFAVRWSINGSVYTGFGMRMNKSLTATYTLNGRPGLVMYELQDDGSLAGIWAVRGVNGSGTEVLTPPR